MIHSHDNLQTFLFDDAPIRGAMATLQTSYQTIINQRPYPAVIKKLLGEALVSCLLLASRMKDWDDIRLQYQGNDNLPQLMVQCDGDLKIRAYAAYAEHQSDEAYKHAFLHGQMQQSVYTPNQNEPYTSMIPIQSLSMGENIAHYFSQSEQVSTFIRLAVDDTRVSGLLLQALPSQTTAEREQFWTYAHMMGQTLHDHELLTLDHATLLHRLYHETNCRLFEPRDVFFQCRCTREKMKAALALVSEEEINAWLNEKDHIEMLCEFCHETHRFDAIDLHDLKRSPR